MIIIFHFSFSLSLLLPGLSAIDFGGRRGLSSFRRVTRNPCLVSVSVNASLTLSPLVTTARRYASGCWHNVGRQYKRRRRRQVTTDHARPGCIGALANNVAPVQVTPPILGDASPRWSQSVLTCRRSQVASPSAHRDAFDYRPPSPWLWRFGVVVARWSRSTRLTYAEPG